MKQTLAHKDPINDTTIGMVRNALLIAGEEMGAEGDHWPVINATIHSVMKDYENLKIERNVSAELQKHYKTMIDQLENSVHLCSEAEKPAAMELVADLRDLHEARFGEMDITAFTIDASAFPPHIQRAEAIIRTLED